MSNLSGTSSKQNVLYNSFIFSREFFSQNIKNWLDNLCKDKKNDLNFLTSHINDIKEKIDLISNIYEDIYSVPKNDSVEVHDENGLTVFNDNIGSGINKIIDNKNGYNSKTLLLIKAPIGSYRNRLLQYIYLYNLAKNAKNGVDEPIFYIDFKYFENTENTDKLRNNITNIKPILNNKKPLFFLDNIRDFKCGMRNSYSTFKDEILYVYDCKIIVGVDTAFTENEKSIINWYEQVFKSGDLKAVNEINITSIKLDRVEACRKFIENCIKFFGSEISITSSLQLNESIYKWLVSQQLLKVDAYQLKEILEALTIEDGIVTENQSIVSIYMTMFDDSELNFDELCEQAFNFEYKQCNEFAKGWEYIRRHKSVLDYCAAQFYAKQLKCAFSNVSTEKISLSELPLLITPKALTRFIEHDIYDNVTVYKAIQDFINIQGDTRRLINNNYILLSQLAYFLGRTRKSFEELPEFDGENDNIRLLNKIKSVIENTPNNKELLVLRSVYISLIYRKSIDDLNEYCIKLIEEKKGKSGYGKNTWNGINNGFHLDYYGDVVEHPICGQEVEFQDDINTIPKRKVHNTFRRLLMDLKEFFADSSANSPYIAVLQLVTFCKLLEVRGYNFDLLDGINPIEKLCGYLEKFTDKPEEYLSGLDAKIVEYLKGELLKLYKYVNGYFSYAVLPEITRQGWKDRQILYNGDTTHAESVAEHSYNCMLMAFMYLTDENDEGYTKNSVINLLLFHDIGEAIIGDFVPSKKDPRIESMEDNEVRRFVRRACTSKSERTECLDLYKDFLNGDTENVNARIAKEIDHLQAAVQYFMYFMDRENNGLEFISEQSRQVAERNQLTDEVKNYNIDEWLEYVDNKQVKTRVGRSIRDKLILENKWFRSDGLLSKRFEEFISKGYTI